MFARNRPWPAALSIVSGTLLAAAHPPLALAPLALVGLIPLLLAIRGRGAWARFGLGWVCGACWSWLMVGVWLAPAARVALDVGPLAAAVVALAATQIYGGLHVALFALVLGREPLRGRFAAPRVAVCWVAVEALRGALAGGIPWGLLGHATWEVPVWNQAAALGGVGLVSFWLALVNAALAQALALRDKRVPALALAAVVLLTASGFGWWALRQPAPWRVAAVEVVHSDWPLLGDRDAERLVQRLVDLSGRGAAEMTVWPEASLRWPPSRRPEMANLLYRWSRDQRRDLLFGAPRAGVGGTYNSVFRVSADDPEVVDFRDKRRLVPLAELPWGGVPWRGGEFQVGESAPTLDAGGRAVGVLVCFESLFPELAFFEEADFLLNPSNDVRVGRGAEQQAAMAVFRAIENGRSLLRVANAGPSMLVDPRGRILATARGWGSSVWEVPLATRRPLQWRWSSWARTLLPERIAGVGWFGLGCMLAAVPLVARRWLRP